MFNLENFQVSSELVGKSLIIIKPVAKKIEKNKVEREDFLEVCYLMLLKLEESDEEDEG